MDSLQECLAPGSLRTDSAAAAVIVQAYDELGRREDLRAALVGACGSLKAVPLDALALWARFELQAGRTAEARGILGDALDYGAGEAREPVLIATCLWSPPCT